MAKADNEKNILHCMNVLRVIGILLVFNSHCDRLYPVSALATGGALGNVLFFIISGFFLKFNDVFLRWIWKKTVRIYPAVFVVTIISSIMIDGVIFSLKPLIGIFVWPTRFWFIGAIMIFYILIYLLNAVHIFKHFGIFSVILWFLYFLYYIAWVDKSLWSVEAVGITSIAGCFKLIYYFYCFALGYYIKNGQHSRKVNGKISGMLAVAFFIVSLGFKVCLNAGLFPMYLQFLSQIFGVAFAYYSVLFALYFEEIWNKSPKFIVKLADQLSASSLEIYLVHFGVIHYCVNIIFPINILLAFTFSFILAAALHAEINYINQKLSNL